jgi:hypothetical protein
VLLGTERHPQWVATTAGSDDDDDKKADDFDKECVGAIGYSVKCQAQLLTDQFERLLEEECLNNAYPIKHKLRDCGMMKKFMTSRSPTRDKEAEGDQVEEV